MCVKFVIWCAVYTRTLHPYSPLHEQKIQNVYEYIVDLESIKIIDVYLEEFIDISKLKFQHFVPYVPPIFNPLWQRVWKRALMGW